jgi:hypothetical protein
MSQRVPAAEEAQRIAAEQAFSPERFLAKADRVEYVHDIRDDLARHRDAVVPALKAAPAASAGAATLNIGFLLMELGDPAGLVAALRLLPDGDARLRRDVLARFTRLPWHRDKGGYQVPFDESALFGAIAPLVDAADAQTRKLALDVLERLATPEARERVAQLVGHRDPAIRVGAAVGLASRGEDRVALAVIELALFSPTQEIYRLVGAIEQLCEGGDTTHRRAAAVAIRFVRQNLSDGDNDVANHVWHCLDGIATVGTADEPELLKEVLASKLQWWTRGIARLTAALADRDFRAAAAEGLATLARGSDDRAVLTALADTLELDNTARMVAALVQAVACAGERPSAEKMAQYAAKWRDEPDANCWTCFGNRADG